MPECGRPIRVAHVRSDAAQDIAYCLMPIQLTVVGKTPDQRGRHRLGDRSNVPKIGLLDRDPTSNGSLSVDPHLHGTLRARRRRGDCRRTGTHTDLCQALACEHGECKCSFATLEYELEIGATLTPSALDPIGGNNAPAIDALDCRKRDLDRTGRGHREIAWTGLVALVDAEQVRATIGAEVQF